MKIYESHTFYFLLHDLGVLLFEPSIILILKEDVVEMLGEFVKSKVGTIFLVGGVFE